MYFPTSYMYLIWIQAVSYIRGSIINVDMKSLNPLEKAKQLINKCVKYFNFGPRSFKLYIGIKRRHGNFEGEYINFIGFFVFHYSV